MRMTPQLSARAARLALAMTLLGPGSLAAQKLDRSIRPQPGPQPPLTLPHIELRTLRNGIPVAIMRDARLPLVKVNALLDITSAVDPADKIGLGNFTLQMLGEGTTHRTADQITDAVAALGGGVTATSIYTITVNLDSALALMADQLLSPRFPQAALDRIKTEAIADIRREREDPGYLALTVARQIIYGAGHPYARHETEASVNAIMRDDIMSFYGKYIRPPNVRFVVVGDITPDAAVAKLDPYFGAWTTGSRGRLGIPTPKGPGQTTIYLYDRPGSSQSVVWISALGPRRDTPDYHAISVMNTILGGSFSSRINLNLRERHGYTYGAYSVFPFRRVPEVGEFTTYAAVQTNKTDSAVIEFMRELRDIRDSRPVTQEEFTFALGSLTKGLPLKFETVQQRARAVVGLLNDSLPLDYYETLSAKLAATTRAQAEKTAQTYIDPGHLAIVVVGDRKNIEPGLRAANVAPVVVVDLDGKPVTNP